MKIYLSCLFIFFFGLSHNVVAQYNFLAEIHYEAAGKPESFQKYLDSRRSRINSEFWKCFSNVQKSFHGKALKVYAMCQKANPSNFIMCQNLPNQFSVWLYNIEPVLRGQMPFSESVIYQAYKKTGGLISDKDFRSYARDAMPYFMCS